ncbi:hypothetical protein AtDm6_0020 [Acetobacter tropicalis]|uniref:Uncharacterized protein n=1 Tax=Acetobacter tropicalis TaxID=104102 RepID=A0A094ZXH1_9PROT|nr:hypothetical protein AtDm6_0020 [Acetobacter tropicalis]
MKTSRFVCNPIQADLTSLVVFPLCFVPARLGKAGTHWAEAQASRPPSTGRAAPVM